jgi:hypothetical protein
MTEWIDELERLAKLRGTALSQEQYQAAVDKLVGVEPNNEEPRGAPGIRWEYREFTEPLQGIRLKWGGGWLVHGGLPGTEPGLAATIAEGVTRLLSRTSQDGWEPAESIAPEALWRAERLKYDTVDDRGFWGKLDGSHARTWLMQELCLNCRRVTTDSA